MTHRLATRNKDSNPLDFGLAIVFDATHGMRAEGRADSKEYRGPWFDGVTAHDVTLSDVADDYAIPGPPAPVDPYAVPYAAHKATWGDKTWLPPHKFPGLVEGAGISYGRIADDENGAFVRDTLLASTLERVDPMDAARDFFMLVLKLKTTAAADGKPLLSDADETAIATAWPNK